MAEDISSYRFDFLQEVAALKTRIGDDAEKFFFIYASPPAPDGQQPADAEIIYEVRGGKISSADYEFYRKYTLNHYKEDSGGSSFYAPVLDFSHTQGKTVGHCVVVNNEDDRLFNVVFENRDLFRLFVLYHEVAHAFFEDIKSGKAHMFGDCAADAYAVLSLLDRFGASVRHFVSMISWERSFDALQGDTSHVSTNVIDRIVADFCNGFYNRCRTHEELVLKAHLYALEWTPDETMLDAAVASFPDVDGDVSLSEYLRLIAGTCLENPVNDYSFYLGAKFFQPFFQPEGVVYAGGETFVMGEPDVLGYQAAIELRTASGLMQIFANAVVPPSPRLLSDMLRASPGVGKPLVFR